MRRALARSVAAEGRLAWAAALVLVGVLGCSSESQQLVVHTASGAGVTAEQLDANPLWLMPGGAIGWGHLDVARTVQSPLGAALLERLNWPAFSKAGFVLTRDVERASVGVFSARGADFVAIATGRFDASRLEGAVGSGAQNLIQSSRYAGREVFSAGPLSLVVITPRTALLGSASGVRRSLDRMADGVRDDTLPTWVHSLLTPQAAVFSVGLDPRSEALAQSAVASASFVQATTAISALGNFEAPGLNLAGTLSHATHEDAASSARAILQAGNALNVYSRLTGHGQPIAKLQTQTVANDAQFVLAVEGEVAKSWLERLPSLPYERSDTSTPTP